MPSDPLVLATPIFAIAMVAEGLCLAGTRRAYSFRRVVAALGSLAYDQLLNGATIVLFVASYTKIHQTACVTTGAFSSFGTTGASVLYGLLAVLLHDMLYYAYHRASHRVNVLWAVHVVHHQSAHYDLTVSLRQGTIATWVTYAFYLPMAFFVPPSVFLGVHAAYQIYQFFVHTEVIRRLGPFEWLFATPSHHRVHHGTNAAYIDKNYGGFFIVFDRMLGTFSEEREPPAYGVPGGYDRVSPAYANLYLFARLAKLSRKASFHEALKIWFGAPEKTPEFTSKAEADPTETKSFAKLLIASGLVLATIASVGASYIQMTTRIALGVLAFACIEWSGPRLGSKKSAI
mgnify:CR=1 FL=1